MTMNNKARRLSSPTIKNLLAEAPVLMQMQNKNRVALACRIDDLIKAKGYNTYSAFALKMGKQSSEITKWLSGSHNFTMNTLDEIAYHLNVETIFLMQPLPEKIIYRKKVVVVIKAIEVQPPSFQGYYTGGSLTNNLGASQLTIHHYNLKTANN